MTTWTIEDLSKTLENICNVANASAVSVGDMGQALRNCSNTLWTAQNQATTITENSLDILEQRITLLEQKVDNLLRPQTQETAVPQNQKWNNKFLDQNLYDKLDRFFYL